MRALLALAFTACASGAERSAPAPPLRASDFRPAQLRQVAVFVRVGLADNSGVHARDRAELAARYESALLEGLDARAVLVRDVHGADARGPLPVAAAAAARAREVGADHALLVIVAVQPELVRVCAETRRPTQGRSNVWKQDARVVRASDAAERARVEVREPAVEVDCESARPAVRQRSNEATATAAVERLLGRLLAP